MVLRRLAPLVAAVAVLVACGGGDPVAAPTPSPSSIPPQPPDVVRFCVETKAYSSVAAGLSGRDPASVKKAFEAATASLAAARRTAPIEIKPDVIVIADAMAPYLRIVAEHHYNLSEVPKGSGDSLRTPAVTSALKRLGAYVAAHCPRT